MKCSLTSAAFALGAVALLGLAPGRAGADGDCASEACAAPALKKVCVSETAVRTNERRVYGEDCEDFCPPKGSLFGGLSRLMGHGHADCDACPSGDCGHCVRTRKFLVVKIKHEEETYTTCSPGYVPEEAKCRAPLFGPK